MVSKVKNGAAHRGALSTDYRFDRTMEGMKVTKVGKGYARCELEVRDGVQNAYKTLHGGAVCTLVDVVGTLALLTIEPTKGTYDRTTKSCEPHYFVVGYTI